MMSHLCYNLKVLKNITELATVVKPSQVANYVRTSQQYFIRHTPVSVVVHNENITPTIRILLQSVKDTRQRLSLIS